jgi:CRP-like cAMP-binding protein
MDSSKGRGDVQTLRKFTIFERFSDDDLNKLVKAAHHTRTSGPWPLILEQTPSDACFIILNGEAGVYVGKEQIALVGPGEVIGESALRSGHLRNATVTTTGPAELLRFERDDFESLLEAIPTLRTVIDETLEKHIPQKG